MPGTTGVLEPEEEDQLALAVLLLNVPSLELIVLRATLKSRPPVLNLFSAENALAMVATLLSDTAATLGVREEEAR